MNYDLIEFLRYSTVRFILVGAFNTAYGYFSGIAIYKLLCDHVNIVIIGLIANIISITVSFSTYKIFVFKTKGKWLKEYLKCYLVYGGMGIVSIFLLWLYMSKLENNIWISQCLVIISTIFISFIAHKNFTFKK